MTVKKVASISRWQCLSSDGFPEESSTEKIPEGSELHIVDTGERYIFYDGTWEPDLRLAYALSLSE